MRSHRASETRVFMARPPAVQVTTPRLQIRTWRAIWFIFSERSKAAVHLLLTTRGEDRQLRWKWLRPPTSPCSARRSTQPNHDCRTNELVEPDPMRTLEGSTGRDCDQNRSEAVDRGCMQTSSDLRTSRAPIH